ncbi:vacuolar membrane-associated protein iml1 [Lunasporangiospora selenospora]|uniref:Vacuolar membrane-associated protein IML1 n=1 Tax=Lunasporangiospora selenospora TaxID=979761 RepID=A0A9P6KHF8_9FUNG|nr:vacuolar membrane-associated protein iml1 [Lunasporangiospora selenospora]
MSGIGSGAALVRGPSPLQQGSVTAGSGTISNSVSASGTTSGYDSPQSSLSATLPSNVVKIHVHSDNYSKRDFLIDPTYFPNMKPNDFFEIYDPALPKESSKKLIIQWTGPDKDMQLKPPVQVSIASNIAAAFGLSPRQDVVAQQVDPMRYAAKYVELTFRDQYVGRSDMWRLRTSLVGSCVYEAKKINYLGCIRVQVKEIYVGNQSVPSGYITSETKIIFRSESAKYFIFIQMSREMWEFDEDGEIFFEKVIFGFLPNLFARWRGKRDGKTKLDPPTNHVVSIVLFSRIFYQEEEEERFQINGYPGEQPSLHRDEEGRYYQDFYKVVIDWEARADWTTAIIPLKEEVMRYQRDILLRSGGEYSILSGENSFAFEGNVLESINLALNSLDKHYVDRDLQRTGLSIVLITPGSGMFDVDKRLLRLTTERMNSSGIGLDMICLSKMPAHIVPLFRWKGPVTDSAALPMAGYSSGHSPSTFSMANSSNIHNNGSSNLAVRSSSALSRPNSRPSSIKDSSSETRPTTPSARAFKASSSNPLPEVQLDTSDPLYYDSPSTFPTSITKTYYMMPHWVDCMFYVNTPGAKSQKFHTRCKMYELQMMGIMEHEISSISIPYLNESYNSQYSSLFGKRLHSSDAFAPKSQHAKTTDYEKHDEDIFHDPNSLLAAEIKQLNINSVHPQKGITRDAVSLDNLESSGKVYSNTRRYEGYLSGGNHQPALSNIKPTSELSRSLPRACYISSMMTSGAIPENHPIKERSSTSGRVSFSLKSANGFLEENRAIKGAEKNVSGSYDQHTEMGMRHGIHDDSNGDQASFGRTAPHSHIDIKTKSGHIRASTEDEPGFSSSSTVKPIYISRNYRNVQEESPSEISGADSCNTGSLSSDKGTRTFISNPTGIGGRIVQTRQRSKQTFINPSNPPKTVIRMTSHLRRWQHAFPRVQSRNASPNLIRSEVYTDGLSNTEAWRGLMSPASLPLTTDYFPSNDELQELYSEYIHTISPSEDSNSYGESDQERRIRAKNLMKELIYHRLAQGFQLIVEGSSSSKSSQGQSGGSRADHPSSQNDPRSNQTEATGSLIKRGLPGSTKKQDTTAARTADEFPSKGVRPVNGNLTGNTTNDKACHLSMGQQVHRLSIDATDGNVEVKRYERRLGYKPEAIKYQCVIWSKNLPCYMPRDLTFTYPLLSHYQWNYLDHLVSGYQEELTEDLLYWRARFILIPTEHIAINSLTNAAGELLDEEELRLAGFQRFLDLFQKARFIDSKADSYSGKRQDFSVKVQPITCSFAAWAFNELSKKEQETGQTSSPASQQAEPVKLNRNSKIQDIATAIQNPYSGVKLQDRRWHLRVYNSVFLGNEVVDWLIHTFMDIDTREEATEFGKKLFDKGLFIHCLGKHHFMDGHYFYQFSGDYAPPTSKQPRGWFRQTTQSLTRRDVDLEKLKEKETESLSEKVTRPPIKLAAGSATGSTATLVSTASAMTDSSAGGGGTGGGAAAQVSSSAIPSFKERMEMIQKMAPPKKVDMSKTIAIDVDPNKRSDRRESAVLHYDLAHNIKHCYHFQLHWLGCTARFIEDMLQSWGRTAERCGLKLVEVPIEQDSQGRAFNPFESPVPIKLAMRPPLTRGYFKPSSTTGGVASEPVQVPKLHFFTELVKLHGFILDMESDELYPPISQLNYSYRRAPYKNIQYVHRSGVAFIQISYNGPFEFLWVNNRLLTSHSIPTPDRERSDWDRSKTGNVSGNSGGGGVGQDSAGGVGGTSASSKGASNHVPNPELLRKKFADTCANKEELARIWNEISSHLETVSGIQDILEDVPDENVGRSWVMPSLAAPRRRSEALIESPHEQQLPGGTENEAGAARKEPLGDVSSVKDLPGATTTTTPMTPTTVPIIRIDMDHSVHEEEHHKEIRGELMLHEDVISRAAPAPSVAAQEDLPGTSSEQPLDDSAVNNDTKATIVEDTTKTEND